MILRGPLLGDCLWLGMIRTAEASSIGETYAPRKTEQSGEPDPLTAPLNRRGFWCQRVLVCQRHCW